MALLKFISLSVGSLMLLQGAYATGETADDKTDDCVKLMNKARSEVGLPNFKAIEGEKNYLNNATSKPTFLPKLCEVLKTEKPVILSKKDENFNGATAAYALKTQDCSAAVDEWKKGFSAFKNDNNTLPAAFELDTASKKASPGEFVYGNAPYNALNAVNFVALYTGKTDATAECALVGCAQDTPQDEKTLVCITYPAALVNADAPYDDKQWQGILNVFAPSASSASAAVPTVLALAAAAVGVALF